MEEILGLFHIQVKPVLMIAGGIMDTVRTLLMCIWWVFVGVVVIGMIVTLGCPSTWEG